MGILDSKSRIIDAILTSEGRRQMAENTFDISYVTFTDSGVSYIPDSQNGHDDPTCKIYFEACNLPQDQITFEANDEGNLVPFRNQEIKASSTAGQVLSEFSEATIMNGRLVTFQSYQGRIVKASSLTQKDSDKNCGFIYSDLNGVTGSVLINPELTAGTHELVVTPIVGPFVCYVGTKGGITAEKFSDAIADGINDLRLISGGPNVIATSKNGSSYLDLNQSSIGTFIYSTGSLSVPFEIYDSSVGGNITLGTVENASFASQIQGILTSSIDNFVELQTISSVNRLFEDDKFSLSTNEITFDLSKNSTKVLQALKDSPPQLNAIDSIFNDDKLSHLENFMYLPPIVKVSDSAVPDKTKLENVRPYLLGDYPSWGDNEKKLTYQKLQRQLNDYEDIKTPIYFEKTSKKNNVIGQFFEISNNAVSKLDVVDYGEIKNDFEDSSIKKVFFVGKTFLDNRGTTCFVNMFTLIFSRDERRLSANEASQ